MFLKCCHLMIDRKGLDFAVLFDSVWYLVSWICHKFCYWGWGMWQRILELCECWLNFWDNLMWRYYFEKSEAHRVFNAGLNNWVTNLFNTSVTAAQLSRNEMWNILQHFHFGGHIGETLVWFTWHKGNFPFDIHMWLQTFNTVSETWR